jgi:carbonic anhydrase/acetyltransferase-like protein (isoleucine patch superfamily)
MWSVVLRMLGARVGKRCILNDMSIGSDVGFVTIGDDVFFGSQVIVCARSEGRTTIRHAGVKVGARVLVAEQGVLLGGCAIGSDVTVGSLTLVDQDVPPMSVVVGSPMLRMGAKSGNMGSISNRLTTAMQAWMQLSSFVPLAILGLLIGVIRRLFDIDLGGQTLAVRLGLVAVPVAYVIGVCMLFVLNVVLLRLPNFSSGQRLLFSWKLITWELVGHVQAEFFLLFGAGLEGFAFLEDGGVGYDDGYPY